VIPSFVHEALPMRVVFGVGALDRLGEEAAALGLSRVLVIRGPGRSDAGRRVAEALGGRAAGLFAEARMHVPADLARRTVEAADELGADGCVTVGGGSAIGLGKAVALARGLPVVAVPTTYAGSEMTPVWGVTEQGHKRTGRDQRVLPRSVLYDPTLTVSLPTMLSVVSGVNALAHAVEGLYAPDTTPIICLMAEEGARALAEALPKVVTDGADLDARAGAQYGAWLCGAVLGATTMSLHHKLCHTLGGMLDLPHAQTHTVLLPHVLAYNQPAAPTAVAALRRAFGAADPAGALWDLTGRLGAPRSLRELGMAEADLPRVVEQAVLRPYANPREVTADGLARLLRRAWAGEPPRDA
jgi:maleylacetate reductase